MNEINSMRWLLLVLTLFCNLTVTANNLYLVTLANTNEVQISDAAKKASDDIKIRFNNIAKRIGYGFSPYEVMGDNFTNKNEVLSTLNRINATNQDIIVVYVVTHGLRMSGQSSPFPYLSLHEGKVLNPNDPLTKNKIIGAEEIYKEVVAKKARFNLLMIDACNPDAWSISEGEFWMKYNGKSLGENNIENNDNYKSLFLKTSGTLILCAAKEGQNSWSFKNIGSYFSKNIDEVLDNIKSENKTQKWSDILNRISSNIAEEIQFSTAIQQQKPQTKQEPFWEFRNFSEDAEAPIYQPVVSTHTFDSATESYLKWLEQGNKLYAQQLYKDALDAFKKALSFKYQDYKALQGIYLCKSMLGDIDFDELDKKEVCRILSNISTSSDFTNERFAFAQYMYGVAIAEGWGDCRKVKFEKAEDWLRMAYKHGIVGACRVWNGATRPKISACDRW